jgi:hypothetical protein
MLRGIALVNIQAQAAPLCHTAAVQADVGKNKTSAELK